jgi:sugar (pentulose or hexulose) kinase
MSPLLFKFGMPVIGSGMEVFMFPYIIKIELGTLSAKTKLTNVDTGDEVSIAVKEYDHGVLITAFPDDRYVAPDYNLQHPQDFLNAIAVTVPEVLRNFEVDRRDVIGISITFSAYTILPLDDEGMPLCFREEWKQQPCAYVKSWKRKSAEVDESLKKCPEIDTAGASFVDAGEWVTAMLTGDRILKISRPASGIDGKKSGLTEYAARRLGLEIGTSVAVVNERECRTGVMRR